MRQSHLLFLLISVCFFTMGHNQDYRFIHLKKTWEEAQSYCRANHRDLATVYDAADMSRLCAGADDCENAWIGLYNKNNAGYHASNRMWHWSLPGVDFIWKQEMWEQGDPNDVNGTENCALMHRSLGLSDDWCCKRHPFICYNDHSLNKYELISDNKTWLEAVNFCREHHTDLLSGLDQIQDPALKQKIYESNGSEWWTGLFKDFWHWSDQRTSSFRNWHEDINKYLCGDGWDNKVCAKLGQHNRWRTEECTEKHSFICLDDHITLVKQNLTWEEALDYCRANHSDLVSITDRGLQEWAKDKARAANSEFVWVGAHYTCFLELWAWVSGEFVVYENWNKTEASECGASAAMEKDGANKWFKRTSEERYNFICSENC